MALKPTYPVHKAFEELCISRATGYKLINEGILETYTVGNRRADPEVSGPLDEERVPTR